MMPWAVLGIFTVFLLVAYIVLQGTRAAMAWRKAAAEGDVIVIRDIVEDAMRGWSAQKRPKEIPVEVWRGIQSMQLSDVGPRYLRVSCTAESEYAMSSGEWLEVRNPLQEGMAVTAGAADMLLYELPHHRPDKVQIDVYTTYRDENGVTHRECILTTAASREQAREVDWEEWPAEEIVRALGGRWRLSDTGRPLPVQPMEPALDDLPPVAAEASGT